jgi:environmental stress-induced protein Ves
VTVQILRTHHRAATPWKNGRGVTREIAAFPRDAGLDSFDWRVSMANVTQGGPFSIFPGVDRVLSVLEGTLDLTFDGGAMLSLTTASEPAAFPGDVAVTARMPSAAVLDLNVMTRRGRIQAKVGRLWLEGSEIILVEETTLVLSLAPAVRLRHASADYSLERHDGMLFTHAEGELIAVEAPGVASLFRIDFIQAGGCSRP